MPDPSITVKGDCNLIDALALIHPTAKKNSLRRMISHGRVRIGEERADHPRQNVPSGSVVTILSRDDGDAPTNPKQGIPEPRVVYSDSQVIVVEKPHGLLSVATDRGEADTMFDRAAKWAWENGRTRALLVHRLDRETSGCLLLARNPEVRDALQAQFKDRTIERVYHAVVHGEPSAQSGTVKARIQETKDMRVRLVKDGKRAGREAITHWELEERGATHSLIRIKIDTGRRAQIRLHMANMGCPVAGDTRHGWGKASVNRLCLHASSLTFDHPNGERMTVQSDIPRALRSELAR
jgi:RluA family pseudouridine synthase